MYYLIAFNAVLLAWQAYNLMRFMKLAGKRFELLEARLSGTEKGTK